MPHYLVGSCSYLQLLDQAETATVSDEGKSFDNICICKKKMFQVKAKQSLKWHNKYKKMAKKSKSIKRLGILGVIHRNLIQIEGSEAGLLNTRLMLSSSFRCDQIYKYELYDFGHTLLCYLSRTLLFNKLASGLLATKAIDI